MATARRLIGSAMLFLVALLWAALSYTAVGSVVREAENSPGIVGIALILWFVGSVALLLALRSAARRLARSNPRQTESPEASRTKSG